MLKFMGDIEEIKRKHSDILRLKYENLEVIFFFFIFQDFQVKLQYLLHFASMTSAELALGYLQLNMKAFLDMQNQLVIWNTMMVMRIHASYYTNWLHIHMCTFFYQNIHCVFW